MLVRAYIKRGTGTALIVPEPMPEGVPLSDEAKKIKGKAAGPENQKVFDLKVRTPINLAKTDISDIEMNSAIGLDKEAALAALAKDKFYISHNPPR